jgi:hypothetical protein
MPANKKTSDSRTTINIEGGVHTGRDFVAGDQYNYGGQSQQIAMVQTPAEFVTELLKFQAQLAAFKQQPQLSTPVVHNLEAVEAQVTEAAEEAQKPVPAGERIRAVLAEAKATMDMIGASVQSAMGLGVTLGALVEAALKLFGH